MQYFQTLPWLNMTYGHRPKTGEDQTLELGGQIYQYFLVTVHVGASAQPMGNPFGPPVEAAQGVFLGQPIAGPFTTYQEAESFEQKLLFPAQCIVVPLPVRLFGKGFGR